MAVCRGLSIVLAALLAVAGVTGCSTGDDAAVYGGSFTFTSPGGQTEISYPPDERKTIGTLRGPDLVTDKRISVSDYSDKVVAINFWGSRCPPCRSEQDALSLISTELADQGVQFLGIDVQEARKSDGQDFHDA